MKLEVLLGGGGDVVEVVAVPLGQDDGGDTRRQSSQDLGLDAPHREHQAAQADLASHGEVAANSAIGVERNQRRVEGHSSAGAVFRNGAGGNVYMQIKLLEELAFDAELL